MILSDINMPGMDSPHQTKRMEAGIMSMYFGDLHPTGDGKPKGQWEGKDGVTDSCYYSSPLLPARLGEFLARPGEVSVHRLKAWLNLGSIRREVLARLQG